MQLKFYAKPEHLVHRPGPKSAGQVHQYLGRRFVRVDDEEGKKAGIAGKHVATAEGFEIDSEAPEAVQVLRYCAKGGLWPANDETAAAAGVAFTNIAFDEKQSEWLPAPEAEPEAVAAEPAPAISPAESTKTRSKNTSNSAE